MRTRLGKHGIHRLLNSILLYPENGKKSKKRILILHVRFHYTAKFIYIVEIYSQLGPLATLLYTRLQKLKILSGLQTSPFNFLKPVLDYYEHNYKKSPHDIDAAKNIKRLMKILPTMKQLKIGLKFKDKKENIVYKIIVDVLGLYLRDYGEITQKVLFINSPNYFLLLVVFERIYSFCNQFLLEHYR